MKQRFCLWVIWLRNQCCLEVFTHPIPSGKPIPRVYKKISAPSWAPKWDPAASLARARSILAFAAFSEDSVDMRKHDWTAFSTIVLERLVHRVVNIECVICNFAHKAYPSSCRLRMAYSRRSAFWLSVRHEDTSRMLASRIFGLKTSMEVGK